MHYEIQHNTLTDGWINTWLYADADGVMRLETFATADEAQEGLDEFFEDLEEEVRAEQSGLYNRDEFRVRHVPGTAAQPDAAAGAL